MDATLLLTVAQAAAQTRIPKRTVQYAITRGQLPAVKLPGTTGPYLIDPADLQAWLAGRTRRAAS